MLLDSVKKHKQLQQSHAGVEKKVQDSHTADSEMEDLSQHGVCRHYTLMCQRFLATQLVFEYSVEMCNSKQKGFDCCIIIFFSSW